jgi:hypothetical protein
LKPIPPSPQPIQPSSKPIQPSPTAIQSSPQPPAAPLLGSRIISVFPETFAEFRGKRFWLQWRGSSKGFKAQEFHRLCDRHTNTLTVILDTEGNIFGGFTPVKWESRVHSGNTGDEDNRWKADDNLKSFLFTLKNPHNIPAKRFALKADRKERAIFGDSGRGPCFGSDIAVFDICNSNTLSYTCFGQCYPNDTGVRGGSFSRIRINSKSRKSRSSRSLDKQHINTCHSQQIHSLVVSTMPSRSALEKIQCGMCEPIPLTLTRFVGRYFSYSRRR